MRVCGWLAGWVSRQRTEFQQQSVECMCVRKEMVWPFSSEKSVVCGDGKEGGREGNYVCNNKKKKDLRFSVRQTAWHLEDALHQPVPHRDAVGTLSS